MHITEFLHEKRVAFDYLPHPPAFTAQRLAKYLRVPGGQVVKAVLLRGGSNSFVALLPATCHVDTDRLSGALRTPIRIAKDREIAEVFRDCEWGVVSPFGGWYGLATLLEDTIAPDAAMVLEANTHVEAIRLRCQDFERLERPRRLRFARKDDGGPGPARLRDVS
jgi:Ala-tRNA(Pro) deacylase